MTHKNLDILRKLVHFSDYKTTKTCLKHRSAVFDNVKRFPWQQSSDIILLLGTDNRDLKYLICSISYKAMEQSLCTSLKHYTLPITVSVYIINKTHQNSLLEP